MSITFPVGTPDEGDTFVHEDETYNYYHGKWVKESSFSVDTSDKLSLDGSTPMTGDINLDKNSITNAQSVNFESNGKINENGEPRIVFNNNVRIKAPSANTDGFLVEGYTYDIDSDSKTYKKQPLIQVKHGGLSKVDDIFLKGQVIIHEGLKIASPHPTGGPFEIYQWNTNFSEEEYYRPNLTDRLLHINPASNAILTSSAYTNGFSSASERSLAPKKYVDDTVSGLASETYVNNAVNNIDVVPPAITINNGNPASPEVGDCWYNKNANTLNIRIS
jgi:hypothetical protein